METFSHRPFLVVVSAPSGTGKTTLCHRAIAALERVRFSVSHTTRKRRRGEVDGRDYYFVEQPVFRRMVERNEFLEWAHVYGNLYGTSVAEVERAAADGVDLIVEIDVQGARQIIEKRPDAVSVFVLPPSMAVLEARLRGRGTDSDEAIAKRLEEARVELSEAGLYQYWIVNDTLDAAVAELIAVVTAERCRRERAVLGEHALASALRVEER